MDITQHKKLVAVGLIAVALLCIIGAISMSGSKEEAQEEPRPENAMHEITEAEPGELTDSKSQGYNTAVTQTQEDTTEIKVSSSERIWHASAAIVDSITTKLHSRTGGKPLTQEQLFGQQETVQPSPAPRPASGNPYRETAQEREERHQRRHAEALALAEKMQEGQQHVITEPPVTETAEPESEPEQAIVPETKVKRSDVISSLDIWDESSGLSSLDEENDISSDDPYTPFRCMFARESKVTDGQRVTVILLDDINVSGISVPRNTHLMATCQLSNRLELEFVNIEIGGRILPLGFEAYDIDGSKGIYCPDAGSAGKTVKSRGTDIISSTLSSRLGRVARDVASTGISLVQSADGQRTVSIPTGYTFFIIKKRQN